MDAVKSLLANPLLWKILLAYWAFSAAVDALPAPKEASSGFYQFTFTFAHSLAGNVKRAATTFNLPGA